MPIFDIELVGDDVQSAGTVQKLADDLGELLGSNKAGTWVRLHYLPRIQYAENDTGIDESVRPVFVSVLKARLEDEDRLATEATAIAGKVSELLERPMQNIHVLFQPDAAGRIAFGGVLLRD